MEEDRVVLVFSGSEFVVPKKAGMAVFELLTGCDIYHRTTRWEKVGSESKDVPYISIVSSYSAPQLRSIGPVEFHVGLENQRAKEEAAAKEGACG